MFQLTIAKRALGAALVVAAGACTDAAIPTEPGQAAVRMAAGPLHESEGRGDFQRYVAIGTSVSMGWASDGVIAASQDQSWPAQLARMAHREITQPLISGTGCQAPLRAPLASGLRISGEAAAAARSTLACAPNVDGITLPTQNVAINAALTQDVLFTTPESVTDPNNGPMYPRVLPSGHTQLTAALAQEPKIVSVELGANEVLSTRTGIAIPGVTMYPVSAWAPLYTRVVDAVAAVAKHGLLVGLIRDVATFPGFRRGAELYADRVMFAAAFNVTVAADCEGSANLLFVPVRVPVAVATGLHMKSLGAGPFTLSCAGAPATIQDFVLTPEEAGSVNGQLAQMNAYIRSEAVRVGFAYSELESLYGLSDIKPAFNVVQFMTSAEPYGRYVSLDGMHPSAAGQRVIATAAADALNAKYGFGIPTALLIAGR
jgi:hypothetical protein